MEQEGEACLVFDIFCLFDLVKILFCRDFFGWSKVGYDIKKNINSEKVKKRKKRNSFSEEERGERVSETQ